MRRIQKAINNPKWAIAMLAYSVAKVGGHREYKRFIVLTRSRTGSTMLRSMLNSHPGIFARGEIFARLRGQSVQEILNETFSLRPSHVKAVGFKIFYYHPLDDDSNQIWDELRQMQELYVIHLKRRNILRTLVSRKIAGKQDIWLLKNDRRQEHSAERRVYFEVDELRKEFEQTRAWEREYGRMFESKPLIDVYYEDLVSRPGHEFKKILDLMDLPYSAPQLKTRKQNPEKLPQLIANYAALKEAFSNSEWSGFFVD